MTDDVSPTKRAIMEATYDALHEQGYGDLTIQAIADEFEKSKSLLYYHYEDKEALLADFLEYALEEFMAEIDLQDHEPLEQLEMLIDATVPETIDEERYRVQIALLELRGQVPHTDVYRERYTEIDRMLTDRVASIIERGVESGAIRDVDVELEAELLVSTILGVQTRRLTTYAEFPIERSRAALFEHVQQRLVAAES
ncbi:TetR/AcrR family transcriptional regulator [Salinarchaeum laminariae]|uniref:TetR/AcrR family transcriptional regulator n=1 Tax=Salinarchaeum laminariae TaxID=869888 RepID=UPI0020BDA090|nr:TetR/AcrR family transcriptional regulator [Salinarchaeum laminariae]